MKLKKINISTRTTDHLIQAVLIFTSVFLAFWLNELRVLNAEKQRTHEAIESVINEVSNNKAILERWMPKHSLMISAAEEFLQNSLDTIQQFNPQFITKGEPIFREILTYDSWDYIKQTGTKLDINDRILISRIYKQQEYVDYSIKELTQNFYKQRELFDNEKRIENYIIYYNLIKEIYAQENAMIREYQYLLNKLRE